MKQHIDANGTAHFCGMDRFGTCRICELIDRDGPHYREEYRKKFHPEEFPGAANATPQLASQPPGVFTKAGNLARAIVEHVAAGMPTVDDETLANRLATCKSCPDMTPNGEGMTCNKCGCRMEIKARWAEQRCPISKWGAVQPAAPAPAE